MHRTFNTNHKLHVDGQAKPVGLSCVDLMPSYAQNCIIYMLIKQGKKMIQKLLLLLI